MASRHGESAHAGVAPRNDGGQNFWSMTRALRTVRAPAEAPAEDRELVKRMRAGEEAAFEVFADRYIPALYRFAAARLGMQRELTRDIVQATVCRVFERLESYRGEAPLFTWLCACCRNEIAGHFRRENNRPTLELDIPEAADSVAAESANPEMLFLDMEMSSLVHMALDLLPSRYASSLQWKYLDGLSVNEIGERLSIGPKAAESLLTRAREAFRTNYEQIAGRRT
jgi:RNA polymerase sigma-70 factor (ECF subfamily)